VAIFFILPETQHKHTTEVVEEIRFRAESISTGHPFRAILSSDETQTLLRAETATNSSASHYRYMSTTG
jgi:hypothetical protein